MEINFIRTDLSVLARQEKLAWSLYLKSALTFLIILAVPAVFFLMDAIDRYTKTGTLTSLSFSLALALICSIIIQIVLLLISSRRNFLATKRMIGLYEKEKESMDFNISIWGISYKGLDMKVEYSWPFFKGFKDHGNSLTIYPRHHARGPMYFEKEEMPEDKFNELRRFLKTRFPADAS